MSWDAVFEKNLEAVRVDPFISHFHQKYKKELVGKRLLDLGCGTGRHAIYFAEKGLDVWAQDKSKVTLATLKQKTNLLKITTVQSGMENIPFAKNYFDVVLSIWVLHHALPKKTLLVLKEIKRVLKEGGLLVVSVLSSADKRAFTGDLIEDNTRLHIKDTFDPEIPHHFFSKEELFNYLKGFNILEINQSSQLSARGYGKFTHWNVIAKKT